MSIVEGLEEQGGQEGGQTLGRLKLGPALLPDRRGVLPHNLHTVWPQVRATGRQVALSRHYLAPAVCQVQAGCQNNLVSAFKEVKKTQQTPQPPG